MKKMNIFIILTYFIAIGLSLQGIGLSPIKPFHLNKGKLTKYLFSIATQQQIPGKAQIRVKFPAEFSQSDVASSLACMAKSDSYAWKTVSCKYTNGSVVLALGAISDERMDILIASPKNPTIYEMSSYFEVCLMYNGSPTSCEKQFGKVVFPAAITPSPVTALYPSVTSLSSTRVGKASTYQFKFDAATTYAAGNTIRVTFPVGYTTSANPICQMSGTYNEIIQTFTWPNKRSIECKQINKQIGTGEVLKIIGIYNPNYAGVFGNQGSDGFAIQILEGSTTVVLQQIFLQKTVTILAGEMQGSIVQANNFIQAKTRYTFKLNLQNTLTSANNDYIRIKMQTPWIFYQEQCSVVTGITLKSDNRLGCTNSTDGTYTYLRVDNFQSASITNQLVFNVFVGTPSTVNTYPVNIITANNNGVIDQLNLNVVLNSTYGTLDMLSINAITANAKVPVDGTGPLQLTFFLNYQLPQTNVLTEGKFIVKIYPQIPLPPSNVNGVLKCYFYNDIPADTCTWDTSDPALTLVTIKTPETTSFRYSQIPITITTEGALTQDKIGITIGNKVTRYRFEMQAYKQDNAGIPTEVFYTEYIADSIPIVITTTFLTKQANQQTAFKIQFTNPYDFVNPLLNNIRIKVQFLNGGWATALGYQADKIYKRFPCIFFRNGGTYDGNVQCDLYTYLDGPHASLSDSSVRGPYILMYGFSAALLSTESYRLEFAKFLLGSSAPSSARLRFSIIEETPSMLTKEIELYYNQFEIFTVEDAAIIDPVANGATLSISNPLINLTPTHTITMTVGSNSYYIVYQYDTQVTPDFNQQLIACSSSTSMCAFFGYPVNWIIQYPNSGGVFGSTVTSSFTITNGIYSGAYQGLARAFGNTGITLYKTTYAINYTPRPITTRNFYMTDSYLYRGVQIYYQVYFRPVTATPSNCFIRLSFGTDMKFGPIPYCKSTNLPIRQPDHRIQCILQDDDHTLKIYNLGALSTGTNYYMNFRAMTLSGGTTKRPTITIRSYYSLDVDYSVLDQIVNTLHNSNQNHYYDIPDKFEIENPKVTQQLPRVNYIGKLSIKFTATTDAYNNARSIVIQLPKHQWNGGMYTTPGNVATDPLVCFLNQDRVPCTYTLTTTLFRIVITQPVLDISENTITLDTEYLVKNGIKHPSQGGSYICILQFYDLSSSLVQSTSFYMQVLASDFRNLYITSYMNDAGYQNIFMFEIYIRGITVASYADSTRYGRIHFQFPTVDQLGDALFEDDLGGYTETGQYVGCDFNVGANYVDSPGNDMRCRLVKSEVPGQPAVVQLLNFQALGSSNYKLQIYIARVRNPTRLVKSVPLSVRMFEVNVATNDIYERYYQTYHVFMNLRTPSPVSDTSIDCNNYNPTYDAFSDGDQVSGGAWMIFYPNIKSPYSPSNIYHYVVKYPKDFTLYHRQSSPFTYCDQLKCLTFRDIGWVLVQANVNPTTSWVRVNLVLPDAISQQDYNIPAMVWQGGRYLYVDNIVLTTACQNQFRGTMSFTGVSNVDDNAYPNDIGRRYMPVKIQFQVSHAVPKGGSIQIKWGNNVPKAYPHCRSMTNIGSVLTAVGGTQNGQIGCLVQSTRNWVITEFNTLPANSQVIIMGHIDMPTSANVYIGPGQVITYNNTHPTSIRANGFIIDYHYDGTFQLRTYDETSFNFDTEITLEETLPLRVSYQGPLQFKFKLASNFPGQNGAKMRVRIPSRSIFGQTGGFSYDNTKKVVCAIKNILTHEEYGCIVMAVTADTTLNNQNTMFEMISSSTLLSTQTYTLRINTYTGIQPQGLLFPTIPGTYKVDITFDMDNSNNFNTHNHLYLQVYGTPFTQLSIQSFVTIQNQPNLIWIKLRPTTTITTTDQIVIEIPTRSSDGTTTIFDDNLGLSIADGDGITIDVIGGAFTNGFMVCRLFHGDRANGKSARIICGGFLQSIQSNQLLYFAVKVMNPDVGGQISIPFFVYSQNIDKMYKSNFNVVENAVMIRTTLLAGVASEPGSIITGGGTNQMQTAGTTLELTARNIWATDAQDYYVLMFNFPLRNNGIIAGGCTDNSNNVYGDAYYHQHLWMIVCSFGSRSMSTSSSGVTGRNLKIGGFYTPWYVLNSNEDDLITYHYHYFQTTWQTSKAIISDAYPNQGPKIPSGGQSLTITPIHNPARYKGSRDDLLIEFVYSNQNNDDIAYVKLIAFIFPNYGFSLLGKDCVQAPTSDVQIEECWIEPGTRYLWIRPVQKTVYRSTMTIAIKTLDLAIAYPTGYNSINQNTFIVKFYSWQNRTESSLGLNPIADNNHVTLMINNLPSVTMSFTNNPTSYAITTFNYIRYPHQRYYKQTPFQTQTHHAPFQFKFQPSVAMNAVSGSSYHKISVYYGTDFKDNTNIYLKSNDLEIYKPLCYLDEKRIRDCSISGNKITMSFQFALIQWGNYDLMFGMIDPRKADAVGFFANKAVSSLRIQYLVAGSSTVYYTETDKFPSLFSIPSGANQGPFRGISDGTIYYGHTLANTLNAVQMTLTFNRTDITALVFEIPLTDALGNQLYSSSYYSSAFLDLEDGSTYPCGNNGLGAGGNVKCVFKKGLFGRLTNPARIIMTDFTYGTQMNCRFIFNNPSNTGAYFSVYVKAYGGQKTATNLYGNLFMGQWQFDNIFSTTSGSPTTASYGRQTRNPTQSPWRDNTIHYVFGQNSNINANQISLAKITLEDTGSSTQDDQFCIATLGSGNLYDDLLEYYQVVGARIYKYAYFFRLWSTGTNIGTSSGNGWELQHLKCKYYQPAFTAYWFFSDTSVEIATNTYNVASGHTLSDSAVSVSPVNKFFDQTSRILGTNAYITVEMDITPSINALTNFQFRNGDAMVLAFEIDWIYWSTISECHVIGGLIATSPTDKLSCTPATSRKVYIRNIAGFQADPSLATNTNLRVKFLFRVTGLIAATTADNNNRQIITQLFANFDAYNSGYQAIFTQSSGIKNNCYYQLQDGTTCTYVHSTQFAGFQLLSATDTSLRVAYKPVTNFVYSTNSYYHRFDIDMFNFGYGSGATVSNFIMQISSSTTPGSGTNNTIAPNNVQQGDNHFRFYFNANIFSNLWGGTGLASDNTWSTGQYIILYLTIAPGSDTIPVLSHAYAFAVGAYNYNVAQIRGDVSFLPTQPLGTSAVISTITNNRGGVTQLSMQVKQLQKSIGPGNQNYLLLAQFSGSSSWTAGNDPFSTYTNTALDDEQIECKCLSSIGPISIATNSPYVDALCRRRLPTSAPFNTFAILISHNANEGEDVRCFFPEFKIASGMSFNVQFKLVYGDTYPIDITESRSYGSLLRVTSNTLSFSGSNPDMSFPSMSVTQVPDFYASSQTVGTAFSTSAYTLNGSWGTNLATPYAYVNYHKAGPVPSVNFCTDSNMYSQCRVYVGMLNLVIARLKSTSVSSFLMSRGSADIYYPSSQYSSSSQFKRTVYVSSGNEWTYVQSITRAQNNLMPISTNSFQVYSDLYGSSRYWFQNTLIFSMSISGKTLYNYMDTGSKIEITFSGVAHKDSCQVWVQLQPLVELTCIISSNKITIYSLRDDYTTSNNIFVSLGITNPSSSSVTFTMKMYDYYYSVSRYSLVISKTATLAIDNSYLSNTEVQKQTVLMKPFRSQFSLIANAPLRIRFRLSSGTVSYATSNSGMFLVTHPQIAYSSNFLCFFTKYDSFVNMDTGTQGVQFKATRFSKSGSTLKIYPPKSHGISSSNYYQLTVMPIGIDNAGCTALGCATQSGFQQTNFEQVNFIAYSAQSTPTILNQQVQRLYAYEGSSKISLQDIFVLCVQPQETSLLVKFKLNFTSTYDYPDHYIQLVFWDLTQSNFIGYGFNDQIPCQLSSNFLSISGRQQPACILTSADYRHNMVKIRIINIGSIVVGTYYMTLDDITLPTPNIYSKANKFDISIIYMGPSNLRYENYFKEIFIIDNNNATAASTLSISFVNPSVTQFGIGVVGTMSFNWPFTTSSGYQSKASFNVRGGYSKTWASADSVTFVDSSGTYLLLWVNLKLNKFIFALPAKSSSTGTTLNITNLLNPYPYQKQDYQSQSSQVQINFYHNYFRHSSNTISQPSFSIFSRPVPIVNIDSNLPSNTLDIFPSTGATANKVAPGATTILRLNVVINQQPANIVARKLDVLDVQFTSGVSYLEQCRVVRNSTVYVNPKSTCQTEKIGGSWHVKIYYVTESQMDIYWWLQVVAQLSSQTIQYTSRLQARNGVVEYQSSYTVSLANYYSTSKIKPTTLSWLNRKYVNNFFENQWRYLEAVPGQTTPYFRLRATVDGGHDGSGDSLTIFLKSSTVFVPQITQHIIVTFLPAVSAERDFGIGCWGEGRRYADGSNYKIVTYPIGCWNTSADYLIQIQEANIITTSFQSFTSPAQHAMTFLRDANSVTFDYDEMRFKPKAYFNSVQIQHTTMTVNDYDTLTITYEPSLTVNAGTSITETVLQLDVSGTYLPDDNAGLKAVYANDGKTVESGFRFSEVVSHPTTNQVTTVKFAQYSNAYAPLSLSLVKTSNYVAGTSYTWRIPLLKNPSNPYIALRYNLSLIHYPSGADYPIVKNFYQSVNQHYTVADTSTSFSPTITNTNRNVQVNNGIDLSINLAGYSLAQWDVINFKLDNSYEGLLQDFTSGSDTSNYDYYFFHTINMVMAQKKTTNTVPTVGIGSASSSINYQRQFKFSWVRVYDTSNTVMLTNPKTLKTGDPPALMLNYLTTYATNGITKLHGSEYQGSAVMYKVDVTVPIIPEGGQIQVIVDSSKIDTDSGASCRVYGANFIRSTNLNQVLRCFRFINGFKIVGFTAIPTSTLLSIYIPIKSKQALTSQNIGIDLYGKYADSTSSIAKKSNIASISHTADSVPASLFYKQEIVTEFYYSYYTNVDYFYELEGSVTLKTSSLTSNSDLIQIGFPGLTWAGDLRMLIKKNDSSVVEWTEMILTSTSPIKFYLPTTYEISMTLETTTEYIWKLTSVRGAQAASSYNGLLTQAWDTVRFQFHSLLNDWTIKDYQYDNFIGTPLPRLLTIVNNNPSAGHKTMLELSFSVDLDASGTIWLEVTFDTNNLLQDMYANDVQDEPVAGQTHKYIDCRERGSNSYISTSRMDCLLYYGDKTKSPPTPALLYIPLTRSLNGYPSAFTMAFLIANIKNPDVQNMNVGVTVKMYKYCINKYNKKCALMQARGFYVTKSAAESVQPVSVSTPLFSPSSPNVLDTSITHTFTIAATATIGSSDAIYIFYPENFEGILHETCTAGGSYTCYAFPKPRWVILKPAGNVISGAGSLTINLSTYMRNGYYSQALSENIVVKVARGSGSQPADVYNIVQQPFTTIKRSTTSGTATSMTISATQNNNIFLRNYANSVEIDLDNIYMDSRIQAIYLKAPSDVTHWNADYCNASITGTSGSTNTYPLRFTCRHFHENSTVPVIQLIPQTQDLYPYNAAWDDYTIKVHVQFTLDGFPPGQPTLYSSSPATSGTFHAYGSVSTTSDDPKYYLSQCSTTIQISQHQVPIISDITFNQKSFAYRTARVGNKQVFYLLLKPTVTNTITKMVFEIPVEFDYPGIFQHDNCFMIGRVKEDQDSCSQSREGGKTLITIVPTNYDNQVKIIQLGSILEQNWFTAPNLPGNFYNMTVELYGYNGANINLLQKQTIDISPVYGQYFDLPSISIKNILDGNIAQSIYDIQFVTGTLQIPPGAITTATTMRSQLQFIFENYNPANVSNVFKNDLGTGLSQGDQVGCLVRAGIVAIQGKRVQCILHIGTNSTDKPIIKLINYDYIDPATTIRISFAGIQSLYEIQVNTISIGVLIHYTDLQSSTYLYIPTASLPQSTTNALEYLSYNYVDINGVSYTWLNYWRFNMYFGGNNIVRQTTTFTVALRAPFDFPSASGSPLSYSSNGEQDFALIKIRPKHLIDPFNPVNITCSNCEDGIQVFYATAIVRFRVRNSLSVAGSGYHYFTFNNFPSSAFQIEDQPIEIDVELYDNYRKVAETTWTNLTRTYEKCALFNFGVLSVSSLNGGQIGVSYTFSMITNHYIPKDGAISITIPGSYGNMVANGVTCELIGFTSTNAYCLIQTPSRVDIYLNGSQLIQTSSYKVVLSGLQNPNQDSSGLIFYMTSYYESNIYENSIICQNSVTPPTITVKSVRTCTLNWAAEFVNKNYNATYTFVLSCNDLFRGQSVLYITLPSQFSTKNNLGNISCTSLESTTLVEDICHLSYINGSYILWTEIQATSQTSLTIQVDLINPTNKTYSASAKVQSRGVVYANTPDSYQTILSTNYTTANSSSVFLMNSPTEAGLMATYIFKISPITSFNPNNLLIEFPDNFFVDYGQLSIGLTTSGNSAFFTYLNYDNVQKIVNNISAVANISLKAYPSFKVSQNKIFMSNISSHLDSTQWTYVFIRGIKNPSAYLRKDFKIAYYIDSTTYKTLQWIMKAPLTYKISSPPKYLAIQNVTVSDNDLLYPSLYSFTFKSGSGEPIAIQGVKLSYVVVIPNFYKSTVWANSDFVCKFDQLAVASPCSNYESQIIITETFTTNYNSLTVKISPLLNPALETYCDTDDVTLLSHTFFRIRIIQVESNKFMFESSSIVDGSNCLKFQNSRIPISLQHSLTMIAGLAYNLTYSITKPAMNLKIKAKTTNSGFTFSPSVVEFDDYYSLKKTTTIYLRSDIPPGPYTIQFQKYESEQQTYFRNILPITITVVSSANSNFDRPTITVPTMSVSTIGHPVTVPIIFSLPSSTQMTLSISIAEQSNQTLVEYSPHLSGFTLEPRIISIVPQQSNFSFIVTHRQLTVPPKLTLKFTLTSVYTIIHDLATTEMTLCFTRDPRYDVLYPPLKVSLTPFASSCNGGDIGKKITNILVSNESSLSSQTDITPEILKLETSNIKSTSATVTISTRTAGSVYYLCLDAGYPLITDTAQITAMSRSDIGITGYVNTSAQNVYVRSTAQINYKGIVDIELLSSETKYTFYAVLSSELGTSQIKSIQFKTEDLSRGVLMKMSFSDIVLPLDIVKACEKIMRISPLRIKVLTSTYELQEIKNNLNQNHNNPKYIYEVVIAPDATNDTNTPLQIVRSFLNQSENLQAFKTIIPSFNKNGQIPYFQLRPVKPRVTIMPKAQVINLYNATFTMKFWERANIYVVLIKSDTQLEDTFTIADEPIEVKRVAQLSDEQKALAPSSQQIRYGRNKNNENLGTYEKIQTQTNSQGWGTMFLNDLKGGSEYFMYITSSYFAPYKPTVIWDDDEVIRVKFRTLYNPNLMRSNRHIDELKKYNPELGAAIERFITNEGKKKNKIKTVS